MPKKLDSTQPFHYYASTVYGWGTALTREAAITMALENSAWGKETKGIEVYSVRVELPHASHYQIEYYTPKDVPLSEKEQGRYRLKARQPVRVEA